MNIKTTLLNFNKHKEKERDLNKKLEELEADTFNLMIDPGNLVNEFSISIERERKWGALSAWIDKYLEDLEIEFDNFEARLWLEMKEKLAKLQKTVKESDIRSTVKSDPMRKKLLFIISRWRYISSKIKNNYKACTKMSFVLGHLKDILHRKG